MSGSSRGRGGRRSVGSEDESSSDDASDDEPSGGLDETEMKTGGHLENKKNAVNGLVEGEGPGGRKKRKQPKWISVRGKKGKKKRRRGKKRR